MKKHFWVRVRVISLNVILNESLEEQIKGFQGEEFLKYFLSEIPDVSVPCVFNEWNSQSGYIKKKSWGETRKAGRVQGLVGPH